jgi:predicted DNA-binding transcriptional regulator AlpA
LKNAKHLFVSIHFNAKLLKSPDKARKPSSASAELIMRYIRFKELKTLVPLGRTTIWRMERDGQFPQSRRIGKNAKAWLEAEVLVWMQERAVDHGKGQAAKAGAAGREVSTGRNRVRRAESD